ncbi:unnamed protein product, partial [Prorocentrum cordatum]
GPLLLSLMVAQVLLLLQLKKTVLHPLQVMLLVALTVKMEATKLLRDYKQTMLDSIKSTVDDAINPFAEQLSKHAEYAAELAQGVKDLPKMVDDAAAKRLDGQSRRLQEQLDGMHIRLRAHETRLDTHDSDISFLKAEIKKLHELLAVANDVPKAPLVSAADFDRDTDPCVVKVIAAKLTALEHVHHTLSDWIAEVGVEAKFFKISSSEASAAASPSTSLELLPLLPVGLPKFSPLNVWDLVNGSASRPPPQMGRPQLFIS